MPQAYFWGVQGGGNVPTHILDKLLFFGEAVIFFENDDDFRADTPRGCINDPMFCSLSPG